MKNKTYKYGLIEYIEPKVTTLYFAPVGTAELATRTCYSSCSGSDNEVIRDIADGVVSPTMDDDLHDALPSKLVAGIVHANQHESVIEHITCSFLVQNTNRAVLQELARHRIGMSLSVQSTRYTVNDIIKLFFVSTYNCGSPRNYFIKEVKKIGVINILNEVLQQLKIGSIYDQMVYLYMNNESEFVSSLLSSKAVDIYHRRDKYKSIDSYREDLFRQKNKRNAGDTVKAIMVDEMFNVDLVLTMNLRSLKHFLKLRDSSAAWKPIQVLAKQIRKQIPEDYLGYIGRRKEE